MARRTKQLGAVLIKPAGPRCNLACQYCFYLDKERLFPGTTAYRMTEAVLDETVGQVLACAGPEDGKMIISFYEPFAFCG